MNRQCEDLDLNEAINVAVGDLVPKYVTENEMLNMTFPFFRSFGNCRLVTDESTESIGLYQIYQHILIKIDGKNASFTWKIVLNKSPLLTFFKNMKHTNEKAIWKIKRIKHKIFELLKNKQSVSLKTNFLLSKKIRALNPIK